MTLAIKELKKNLDKKDSELKGLRTTLGELEWESFDW